jgi:DNA-binding MarR family transcriptional regulator
MAQTNKAVGLLKTLKRLRDQHADMTVFQAQFFVAIASSDPEEVNQRELWRDLDSSDSVASRTLALLSDIGSRTTTGLDLLVLRTNPMDRRERLVSLSSKGRRLWHDIMNDFK